MVRLILGNLFHPPLSVSSLVTPSPCLQEVQLAETLLPSEER